MSDSFEPLVALRNHRQLEQASCAVSAFEAVAKLHGLIEPTSFPLQSDPANQLKGFGDTEFLRSLGILPSDGHYDIQSALNLIEKETSGGKFPLAAFVKEIVGAQVRVHVYLAARDKTKLVLIDPAVPAIVAEGREGLGRLFQRSIQMYPPISDIHVMIYDGPPPKIHSGGA